MDSTGGDLSHAAVRVEQNVEKGASLDPSYARTSTGDVVGEKESRHAFSSDSSSQDSAPVEKLDSKIVKVHDSPDEDEVYAHLPDHEKVIVKRQLAIPEVKVSFVTLFRYATRNDLIILVISAICAIVGGAVMPLMTVCASRVLSEFRPF